MAATFAVSTYAFLRVDDYHQAKVATLTPASLSTWLDAQVPFVPAFIFVYALYYVWMLWPLFVLSRRLDFYRGLGAFGLIQAAAFAVFILCPSRMARPNELPDGAAGYLLALLYQVDEGWNVFPSLHVAHSVFVALLVWRFRRSWWLPIACGSTLISLSTVLIKQHYVVDIPAGAVLAMVAFCVAGLHRSAAPAHRSTGGALTGTVEQR